MAQPWQMIKGGGSATPDPLRQARATKARSGPRAPRVLGWTRTEGQRRFARMLERLSVLSIAVMVIACGVGLLLGGDEPLRFYGITALVAFGIVHLVVFLADTLSNGASQLGVWCVVAFWTILLGVPLLIML